MLCFWFQTIFEDSQMSKNDRILVVKLICAKTKFLASKMRDFGRFLRRNQTHPWFHTIFEDSQVSKNPSISRAAKSSLQTQISLYRKWRFWTFSEAKTDPPLSGYEFCSKLNYDLTIPKTRRKTMMSKKSLIFIIVSENQGFGTKY